MNKPVFIQIVTFVIIENWLPVCVFCVFFSTNVIGASALVFQSLNANQQKCHSVEQRKFSPYNNQAQKVTLEIGFISAEVQHLHSTSPK